MLKLPKLARRSLIALAALALAGGGYIYMVTIPQLTPLARVATGYMARVACACHFVAGRPLTSCLSDAEPGMERVRISADAATRRIVATVPLVATASAHHLPGQGCTLDP